jgi:hypothetical protein
MVSNTLRSTNIFSRLWIYQAERFPVLGNGLLIAAFSFSAVSFSRLLRGMDAWLALNTFIVCFASAFFSFLQLRLADEFKDFDEDSAYRPYRPVPRGLVTLRELGMLWILTGLFQLGLAIWLNPALMPFLLVVWGYLGLMSKEFFVRNWLKAHPITYMWTHMLIVPLIDFYTTACDWRVAGNLVPPSGLTWFLVASFFNGVVIEIGRKIRAPLDEEHGVETYTFLWGRNKAVLAWLGALALTALCASLAASEIGFLNPVGPLLIGILVITAVIALRFLQKPIKQHAKLIETASGLWTILMYLSVGALPLFLRVIF